MPPVGNRRAAPGKTDEDCDVVRGRSLELVPQERSLQLVEFGSEDPAFAGGMTVTWTLAALPRGTGVIILFENLREGIRKEDHDAGLRSSLGTLATFTE